MKRICLVVVICLVQACAPTQVWVPALANHSSEQDVTLVWVGKSEAERFENGSWVRVPAFDYDFSVEQRRMGNHWESVKSMRRRHPDYDGSAGPRLLTYFFHIDYSRPQAGAPVEAHLTSSMGAGEGTIDPEFRSGVLNIVPAELSRFAPFDHFRITQNYGYEKGELTETVELNKGQTPWVRNHEVAHLYGERQFQGPPTSFLAAQK